MNTAAAVSGVIIRPTIAQDKADFAEASNQKPPSYNPLGDFFRKVVNKLRANKARKMAEKLKVAQRKAAAKATAEDEKKQKEKNATAVASDAMRKRKKAPKKSSAYFHAISTSLDSARHEARQLGPAVGQVGAALLNIRTNENTFTKLPDNNNNNNNTDKDSASAAEVISPTSVKQTVVVPTPRFLEIQAKFQTHQLKRGWKDGYMTGYQEGVVDIVLTKEDPLSLISASAKPFKRWIRKLFPERVAAAASTFVLRAKGGLKTDRESALHQLLIKHSKEWRDGFWVGYQDCARDSQTKADPLGVFGTYLELRTAGEDAVTAPVAAKNAADEEEEHDDEEKTGPAVGTGFMRVQSSSKGARPRPTKVRLDPSIYSRSDDEVDFCPCGSNECIEKNRQAQLRKQQKQH